MATAAILVLGGVAVVMPGPGRGGDWQLGDRILMVGLGVAIASLLWRYASIRAVPRPEGLRVRNLMLTRTIGWDEIVEVRFVEGDPWVSLELDDTDTVAVMAIQRADGDSARVEAARLALLVEDRRAA